MYCGTQLGGCLTQDPPSTRTITKITKSSKTLKGPYQCPTTVSEEPKSPKPCNFLPNPVIRAGTKTLLNNLSLRNNTPYCSRWSRMPLPRETTAQAPKRPETCSYCANEARKRSENCNLQVPSRGGTRTFPAGSPVARVRPGGCGHLAKDDSVQCRSSHWCLTSLEVLPVQVSGLACSTCLAA